MFQTVPMKISSIGRYLPQRVVTAEGSIRLDGMELTNLPPHQITALGVSRTFQITRGLAHLTVLENMVAAAPPRSLWGAVRLEGRQSRGRPSHGAPRIRRNGTKAGRVRRGRGVQGLVASTGGALGSSTLEEAG